MLRYYGSTRRTGGVLRFFEGGPNLPDELLLAHDDGQVVLFCGSGVSRARANLPDFAGLARAVLDKLGAGETSEARQLYNFMQELQLAGRYRGIVSADLIFGKLARDFSSREIDRTVAQCLTPVGDPDLSAHKTVLRLARLPGGDTRLITTNFDLLFEACDRKLPSSTRSTLPRLQFADNNWGVVHVHGRLAANYATCDRDGLVLTSAQFGDAYLAQGWARDFVRDVLERHVAVFIGYSADDPPMRYLLEGLQQAGGLKHSAYAFLFGSDEEAIAQWREKGVKALCYGSGEGTNHDALWETLDAWGKRAANSEDWRRKVFAMARKGPQKLRAHQRGMLAHIVKSQGGARAFSKETPPLPSEWLCVFDSAIRFGQAQPEGGRFGRGRIIDPFSMYCLDDDPPRPAGTEDEPHPSRIPTEAWSAFFLTHDDRSVTDDARLTWIRGHWAANMPHLPLRLDALADWFVRVAGQPAAVWWAAQQAAIHPDIVTRVKLHLNGQAGKEVPDAIKQAWKAIFEYHGRLPHDGDARYQFEAELHLGGWDAFTAGRLGRTFEPRLRIGSTYCGPIPPAKSTKLARNRFVSLSVEYPDNIGAVAVPDEQLAPVLQALRSNIELAVRLEQEYGYFDDICSIEPDEAVEEDDNRFERSYALSGYVLHFVMLFRRLLSVDAKAARAEFEQWSSAHPIFARLRIWAGGLTDVANASEFAAIVLGSSDDAFWPFRGERDLMLGLRRRWPELDLGSRKKIEARIAKGKPRSPRLSHEDHTRRSAHVRLSRFLWMEKQGLALSLDLAKFAEKLRPLVPNWKDEWADNAASSHDGRSGTVRTNKDWSALEGVSLSQLVEVADSKKGRGEDFLTKFDPFRGLLEAKPLRALGALTRQLKSGGFSGQYWSAFLDADVRKGDTLRFNLLVCGRVLQIPEAHFAQLLLQASRWFEISGPKLREASPELFNRLWTKFIDTAAHDANAASSALVRQGDVVDWATEALNSPAGNLAELHMTDPLKIDLKAAQGFPKEWLKRAEQLLALPGDSRRYALVIFTFNLSYFYTIDPDWTEKTFLSILDTDDNGEADKEALWSGFMWGARFPPKGLFARLKSALIEMASRPTQRRRRHAEILSGILLAGWGSHDEKSGERFVSSEELRSILIAADDGFRGQLLWNLENWSRKSEAEDQDSGDGEKSDPSPKANKWADALPDFLENVWPKHTKVQTARASARLVDIALSQGDNFPAIARIVSKIVTPVENEQIDIPELRRSKGSLAARFPNEMLELLYAILPENPQRWPYSAPQALKEIETAEPKLLNDLRLIELKRRLGDM